MGKTGHSGRWVRGGPATPEREGEDWLVCLPRSRGGSGTLVGSPSVIRRHRAPWVRLLLMGHPARWPRPSEGLQGDAGGAYVVLGRFVVTEHGLAWRTRVPRSRRAKSPRGRDAPPGRTGEPGPGGKWPRGSPAQRLGGPRDAARRSRTGHEASEARNRPLESGWRAKDSRAVWSGAIGKVPVRATRWWPTLPPARF